MFVWSGAESLPFLLPRQVTAIDNSLVRHLVSKKERESPGPVTVRADSPVSSMFVGESALSLFVGFHTGLRVVGLLHLIESCERDTIRVNLVVKIL